MTYVSVVKLVICFHEPWPLSEDEFVIWAPGLKNKTCVREKMCYQWAAKCPCKNLLGPIHLY